LSAAHFGRLRVELSRLDKVLFPEADISKGDLLAYYDDVASVILPHLRDRPLALERFPDGITSEGFIQQQRSDYFPSWISNCPTPRADDASRVVDHVVCSNRATLTYLANQAAVTLHGWLSRASDLECPDRLVFDLDPPNDAFEAVRTTALTVFAHLRSLGMNPFVMTTGSRGLHVVAPLRPTAGFDEVRQFATRVADRLAHRHPEAMTTAQRKAKRGDRVYLDMSRNAYGQTTVVPYSVRALPDAPVATPLQPDELNDTRLHARRWTLENVRQRLERHGDPWKAMGRRATVLHTARHAFEALD
jgi:bifunctional non-homologous end joining protein LigD